MNTERWLSVLEIASHLGVSKETVYRWLEQQKIPGHKIGRLWKFRSSEVDAWVIDGGATERPDELQPKKNFESSSMESETT